VRIVLDLETNGLLDRPDLRVLCAAWADLDTDDPPVIVEAGESLQDFFTALRTSPPELLIGHNLIGFDLPVISRLFGVDLTSPIFDTKIVAAMVYASNLSEVSLTTFGDDFPKYLLSPARINSLAAWGYRLGKLKGTLLKDLGIP